MLGYGALAVAGCGDPVVTPGTDAGTDTGTITPDGGRDSGPPIGDGGVDSGTDAAVTDGGTDAAPPVDGGPPPMARTTPTNGSAIVLSADDSVMVACNREAGSVTIFSVSTATPPVVTQTAEIDLPGAEPWAAVIGNDDDTAYVILRATGEVVRINDLDGTPTLDATRATVGNEPTGIAISPLGGNLWVANWADGTVSLVSSTTLAVSPAIDLNAALVATGSLGTVTSRPGLAHPRAIVISNNGDTSELDESIYVTEYFGQARTDTLPTDDTRFDLARRGIIYRLNSLGMLQPSITLAPVASTGFLDSTGADTGCFPNQLLSTTISSGRLYVTGVCASPRGPTGPILDAATGLPVAGATGTANFKTEIHSTIWAVNLTDGDEDTSQRVLLTREFQDLYDGTTPPTPDDGASRRIPLIANDIAFVPGSTIAYVTSYGSDAIFRIEYDTDGTVLRVGSTAANFINLAPATMPTAVGRLPYGIAIANTGTGFAHVINETTRNVSLVGLGTQALLGATLSSALPAAGSAEQNRLDGRRFFVTGLGRWSFRGQGWNSCETCHGDGLTDGVTWFFARGPRQSTSLDGTFDSADPTQQRVLNWTAIFDEVHDFELNTRGNSGGVGAIVDATSTPAVASDRIRFDGAALPLDQTATPTPQAGLNGSTNQLMPDGAITPRSLLADWDHMEEYIQSIRSPNAPSQLAAADVTAGAALFVTHNCAGCHGTTMWTTSRVFWTPGEATNAAAGSLRTTSYVAPALFPMALNPPSAGAGRTATLRFPAGATAGANDQIQCVLRAVGTMPATGTMPVIVAGSGVQLSEVRADMSTRAQGDSGFNPPSLLGLGTGAPYFHGGNARTLEEIFDPAFAAHYQAMSVNFLTMPATRDAEVRQMVAYLLSIDESTTPVAVPTAALGYDPRLCPLTHP